MRKYRHIADAEKKKVRVANLRANPSKSPGRKVYSAEETNRHEEYVEALLEQSTSNHKVMRMARKPPIHDRGQPGYPGGLGISAERIEKIIERIRARWEEDAKHRSRSSREAAIKRTMKNIQNAQGRRNADGTWKLKPDFKALAAFEQHLARLEGTYAPTQIDVNVRASEALVASFANYTVDRLKELHERAQAAKRLANAYVEEHPEARELLVVGEVEK